MTRLLTLIAALLVLALPAAAQEQPSDRWFEVEALNAGLGPAPDLIDRSTPQSAIESFIAAAAREDWSAAAHVLDLSAWPEARQAEEGPEIARQLFVVLDRRIVIDWHALLDRPDGLDAQATSDSAMAGEPRRSLLLAIVDLPGRPVTVRLSRVKGGGAGAEPAWVFARQTVENVPAMHAIYGPSDLEELLPERLRLEAVWGLRWWEVIALPLSVLMAVAIGWAVHWLMSRGKGRSFRDEGRHSFRIALRPPLVLFVFTTTVWVFTSYLFVFSGRIDMFVSPLVAVGFVTAILWSIVNVVDVVLDRLVSFEGGEMTGVGAGREEQRQLATNIAAARRAVIVMVVLIGGGIVLRQANVLQTLGFSLLASAGAMTLVIAFAARNVLANIMASMQIAMNQSAKIGDKIVYDGHLCAVERINFTFVQLRVWTGERLVVPVSRFVAEPFENWTMHDPFMVRTIVLRLAHTADVEALRSCYHRILDAHGDPETDPGERAVYVTDHDAYGIAVMLLVPSSDPNAAWALACDVRERLLAAAADMGTEARPIFPDVAAAA